MKKKTRTFVLGDLHGGYKALMQVLERSKFDYDNDRLISLGDVADGWPYVTECFEELLKIKNLVMVRGNHDQWLLDYLRFEETPRVWITQGGLNSFESYQRNPELKEKHRDFLMSTPYYFIDEKNRLYVHGGIKPGVDPKDVPPIELMWDRNLWYSAEPIYIPGFKEVYVGHTTTWTHKKEPFKRENVWFMDQGGGWEGKLSLMNVDTKKVFQSDKLSEVYPEGHG